MPLRLARLGLLTMLVSLGLSKTAGAGTYQIGADYVKAFGQTDPNLNFNIAVSQRSAPTWGLFLAQGLAKNFYIDTETDEWELADSVVGLNLYPRTLIPNVQWTLRLQMTLPLSRSSQLNEVYSKPELRLFSSYPVLPELNLGLNVFGRYTMSRFQSTAIQDGLGGDPLPQFSYGLAHFGAWQCSEAWNISYLLSYTEIMYHEQDYEGIAAAALYRAPDQAYSLAASLGYQLNVSTSLSLGYSYGGLLLQPGLDDYVLFDDEESRWSIGIGYTLGNYSDRINR